MSSISGDQLTVKSICDVIPKPLEWKVLSWKCEGRSCKMWSRRRAVLFISSSTAGIAHWHLFSVCPQPDGGQFACECSCVFSWAAEHQERWQISTPWQMGQRLCYSVVIKHLGNPICMQCPKLTLGGTSQKHPTVSLILTNKTSHTPAICTCSKSLTEFRSVLLFCL